MSDIAGAGREVELKLAIASDGARAAADRELRGIAPRSVETIYFDTSRRRLLSAGYSLRLRRDGEAWSQSVKASGGVDRYESDHPLPAGLPDFALLEGTPIADLADEPLRPVFVSRVRRRSRRRLEGGSRIEVSLDEGELIARGRTWPIHELELELKSGAPAALFDRGRRLAEVEAFVPAFLSKAERGFALADGLLGEPVKFAARPLDGEMTAVAAFQAIARRCLRQLALNAELISGGDRLEATHQARTALRRLRVAIGVFRDLLAADRLGAITAELVWLTGELSDARNLDVFLTETFRKAAGRLADRESAAGLGRALLADQARAHARARTALHSSRFRLLLLETARWIEADPRPPEGLGEAEPRARGFAAEALDRRRRTLRRRAEGLDWRDPIARHHLRIAAKKMRYAAEFFVELGPDSLSDRYRPFLRALETMQDRLGRLNDLTVAEPMLLAALDAAANEGDPRRLGYAAGRIMGRADRRGGRRLKSARRATRDLVEAPAWW